MKAYTDIEQSKKLAEILPLESADMTYRWFGKVLNVDSYEVSYGRDSISGKDIPCWSLAALLDVYPMCVGRDLGMFCCWVNLKSMCSSHFDNPVDACVDMILKLKERNLI